MPSPLIGRIVGVKKGTCDDCLLGCPDCVELSRMVWACACTCLDLAPQAAASHMPIEDCGCQDGVTTFPGSIITGVKLGWTPLADPSMDELPRAAYILTYFSLGSGGANEDVTYTLYGKNSPGDCPMGIDGWTPLGSWVNPVGGGLVFDESGEPIEWAEEADGGIIGPTGTLPNGTNCVQTGGYTEYQLRLTTSDDQFLFECHFPGVIPPPQCDRQLCCSYSVIVGPNLSEEGGDATISIVLRRGDDCGCVPLGELKFDDGVNPPTTYTLTEVTEPHDFVVEGYIPGQTVTITLTTTYPGCGDPSSCIDSFDVLIGIVTL